MTTMMMMMMMMLWWWCYDDDGQSGQTIWSWSWLFCAGAVISAEIKIVLKRGFILLLNGSFVVKEKTFHFTFAFCSKLLLLFMVEHWFGWALGWWDRGEVESGCSHLDLRSHSWYIVWNTLCNFVLRSIWYLFIELNISFSTYLYLFVPICTYLYLFVLLLVTLVPCHAFSTWNLDLQKSMSLLWNFWYWLS